jgi:glycosyltransferase involved in cell wall biosynthesis
MKSIGILKTVYNQANFVDRMVSNINEYASPQIRTFIQDDCSLDETYEHYLAAKPAFTKITKTAVNEGARANIASLLRECDTDYLTFSAGDDFIYPSAIHALLETIQQDDPDIVILNAIRVPENLAFPLPSEHEISTQSSFKGCNNNFFSVKWKSSNEMMVAIATFPGLIWSQGLLVKTDLAKRAGFPPSGGVDDWAFQHNLAVLAISEKSKITLIDRNLGVLCMQQGSMGMDVMKQLERQVDVIHRYWHPSFKKQALLNCLNKKLQQFRGGPFTYEEVLDGLASTLSRNS